VLAKVLPDRVAGAGQRQTQGDVVPGLLPDLADRGLGQGLSLVDLALGPGPVAVPGAVDEQDLEPVAPLPPQDAPGGEDVCVQARRFAGVADRGGTHPRCWDQRRRWTRWSDCW